MRDRPVLVLLFSQWLIMPLSGLKKKIGSFSLLLDGWEQGLQAVKRWEHGSCYECCKGGQWNGNVYDVTSFHVPWKTLDDRMMITVHVEHGSKPERNPILSALVRMLWLCGSYTWLMWFCIKHNLVKGLAKWSWNGDHFNAEISLENVGVIILRGGNPK